ncbi:MAG: hypothetical protein A2V60_02065 [Candidatus Portnoybacteria bacterium RIFCSPHIGHO2_01_FULL_39_19]|nr:MAG: hypothetical protein A2V60_02065 [Candidatus Portnoybacteria bacterium RIFCSPHIGHO2_01_FULL_39_19]
MKNLRRLFDKMDELKSLIPEGDMREFHRLFDLHLSKGGHDSESRSVVGRVHQEHVVIGKIMQYDRYPIFRAAILNNWNWMVLDPPQPIFNEHNYWEVCYQMGFGARNLFCVSTGKEFRSKMYTPTFVISISDKLPFGQRASVEVRICEKTRKGMDFCTILFRFYTSEKRIIAEAGLEVVAFRRDYEILLKESATSEEAKKKLISLIIRKNRQRQKLGLSFLMESDLNALTTSVENGTTNKTVVEQIMNLW